jgi:hypothetical protein
MNEVIQERTIYARPLNFRPKLLWVVMRESVPVNQETEISVAEGKEMFALF